MNPEKFLHHTSFSVQLPYIAGHFKVIILFSSMNNEHDTAIVPSKLQYTFIKIQDTLNYLNFFLPISKLYGTHLN